VTTRQAYDHVGGHSSIRDSLHDGVTLPRAYRRAGYQTDIYDASDIAVCRMYHSARELWYGLAKNAHEGLGAWPMIVVWTCLLFGGHVMPIVLMFFWNSLELWQIGLVTIAAICSWGPRLDAARRFQGSLLGAVMHPLGVTVLLSIQWDALLRRLCGIPVGWKGRPNPAR
jgi:hypothetical protein